MSRAIEILMNEHRTIEKVLTSLETYAEEVQGGAALDRVRAAEFGDFFARFADACHHRKEEDLLFRKMIACGFPADSGPIAVMLYEHTVGRGHVGTLKAIGGASGAATAADVETFASTALAYGPFLKAHIQKEDGILYPLALRVIPPAELAVLVERYEEFERNVVGQSVLDELARLGEKLVAAHPFDPARLDRRPIGMSGFGG